MLELRIAITSLNAINFKTFNYLVNKDKKVRAALTTSIFNFSVLILLTIILCWMLGTLPALLTAPANASLFSVSWDSI